MKRAAGRGGAAWALLAAAAAAPAQETPRERTGPAAQPPLVPAFPAPSELQRASAPVEAAPQAAEQSGAPIREVRVNVEDGEAGAVPPGEWRPPEAAVGGLSLDHRPGEPLDPAWVRRQFALNGFGGSGAPLSAAVALVQLLNRAFITAGFVNTGLLVPAQPRLGEGVLELELVYGRLAPASEGGQPVTVAWGPAGAHGLSEHYVRRRFPSAAGRPLSALDVERDFRLLAESLAVRTVNADLRPGARPGEASLHLIVHPERPFDLYTGFANDRSPSVGATRMSAGGHIRNAFGPGDLFSWEAGITRGLSDGQLGYSAPFFSPRTSMTIRASFNDAAVVDRPLLPLDISARDRSIEGGLVHRLHEEPLTPAGEGRWRPSRTLSAGLLLAYRHQRSFLFGQPFSFAPGSVNGRSRYAVLRFTTDYVARGASQVLALSATATLGLGGTQSDVSGVQNPDENFVAWLVQANYARRLGASGLELRARVTGQIASSILYSGERLSIGGQDSVRGYRESLFLVDSGLIGTAELAYGFTLSGGGATSRRFDWGAFSLSAFADAALGQNREEPQPAESFIASVGASLAWAPSDAIRASLGYGHALSDVRLSGTRNLQDRGIHFRVTLYPLRLF